LLFYKVNANYFMELASHPKVAGINEQSNLIAAFQTALSVQTIRKEEAAAPPPAPLKPAATSNQAPPAGK